MITQAANLSNALTAPAKTAENSTSTKWKITPAIVLGGMAVTAVVGYIALHSMSFIAQWVITPVMIGIAVGIAAHIVWKGPEESMRCGKKIAQATFDGTKYLIRKMPSAFEATGEFVVRTTQQTFHQALQMIGREVNPPSDKPYTVAQVAKGIGIKTKEGIGRAFRAAKPHVISGAKKGRDLAKRAVVDLAEKMKGKKSPRKTLA